MHPCPFSKGGIPLKDLRTYAKLLKNCYDYSFTSRYILEYCKEEADEVIRQADMLLNNTFVYMDRWDMEPCATPYTISLDTWEDSPNGDPEWVFMLNRHDFLNKLWQAYVLTGNRVYTEKLRFFILDWIEKNPITLQGTDATRTIDTGIRCMNWSTLLLHLLADDIISDADARLIIHSLREQYNNMYGRYIGKYALSNWGALQTTAICVGYIWLADFLPDNVIRWAWDELKLQLSLQILGDGSHWEQSAMYHVEVLNTCVKLLAQLRFANLIEKPVNIMASNAVDSKSAWTDAREAAAKPGEGFHPDAPGWLTEAIRVLSRHVLHSSDPSFQQLAQCDSDVTDVRDVMARAAALLPGGGIYRYAAGETMDMDSAWLLGRPGIHSFQRVTPAIPQLCSWNCDDSGNIFFRSEWSRDAAFTWLKNGTLGSSHGHADQTHLSMYYKGKPFLIDSGRYTYLEGDPLRVLLKKPCAHNVCVIDGQSGGEPDGSWSYHRYDETLKNYFAEAENAHYAEMAFHGTLLNGTPYLIKRKILVLDDGIWLSTQDAVCQGTHQVKEYFHLDSNVCVEPGKEHYLIHNEDVSLSITPSENLQFRFGVISKRYNEKQYAPILVKVNQMQDRLTTQTMICDAKYKVNSVPVYQLRKEDPVSSDVAAAWDVEKPDGTKKTLILWNRETYRGDKLYICHGRSVYGKAIVLSWTEDGCRVIRLKT